MLAVNQASIVQCGMYWRRISVRDEPRRIRIRAISDLSAGSTAKSRHSSTAGQARFTTLAGLESKAVRNASPELKQNLLWID